MRAPRAPAGATGSPLRVLHAAAEVYPLVKTGGLADVAAALPAAQARLGADVRLLLPGYPAVLAGIPARRPVAEIGSVFGAGGVRLVRGRERASGLVAYVIEAPGLYERDGGPYMDARGHEWFDNLQRFALLGWVAAQLGLGALDGRWRPDALHTHDWHAGLAAAYLRPWQPPSLATVFTIHNMAFLGRFALRDAPLAGLASGLLTPQGMEFHGDFSCLKAALRWCDRVTTVSPSYAREIATPEFGCGLDGLVRERGEEVVGILNGIDDTVWNPARDPSLPQSFDAQDPGGKRAARAALLSAQGIGAGDDDLVLTVVSRLSPQKGMDLLLHAMPTLLAEGVRMVLIGSGDAGLEQAWRDLARTAPDRVSVTIGYDEEAAHRAIAGADAIAVPSRFEPCGLTQLYGLRYGTVPVVRRVGGLADTVQEGFSGFTFDEPHAGALIGAVQRAAAARRDHARWRELQQNGMRRESGWQQPAQRYLDLYRDVLAARAGVAAAAG